MKYLGIDWGKSKIGLAIGDDELKIASPFKIVSDFNELIEVLEVEEIERVVLGEPVKMCGDSESCMIEYNEFYKRLKKRIPVELIDERLTTRQAIGMMQGQKGRKDEDSVSAMLILQNYFDR